MLGSHECMMTDFSSIDIGFSGVMERSIVNEMTTSRYPEQHIINFEDMKGSIIQPLQQQGAMGSFHTVLAKAEEGIATGLLRNPRDVEVTLLAFCKVRLAR